MSQKPTYFLTPPRPYPPSGPIRLGAIISSPTLPDEPICLPPLPSAESSLATTFTEQNWSGSHIRKSSASFGVWTSFLQMIFSVGGDVEVEIGKGEKKAWEVDSMTTTSFLPGSEWLDDVCKREEVRKYVVANSFREKIYVVTGVMIARGTKMFTEKLKKKNLYIKAGVDATAWTGVPISVGPQGSWSKKEMVRTQSSTDEEFVFAFRMREVRVKRKGGVKSDKAYNKGALFDLDSGRKRVQVEAEVEVEGLADEDDAEEFGLEANKVWQACGEDGGVEECICIMPEE